ncbi:MAG TPA: DUF3096 domain-containing protein [Actinomycetota bacterium]|jgi:hypothetical protein|nr:DUF3096 domain-containing protein [Actinomycetota bacterium]
MIGLIAANNTSINLHLELPGVVALVAGIVILVVPKTLNYVVAGYLILVGLIQVFDLHI